MCVFGEGGCGRVRRGKVGGEVWEGCVWGVLAKGGGWRGGGGEVGKDWGGG